MLGREPIPFFLKLAIFFAEVTIVVGLLTRLGITPPSVIAAVMVGSIGTTVQYAIGRSTPPDAAWWRRTFIVLLAVHAILVIVALVIARSIPDANL